MPIFFNVYSKTDVSTIELDYLRQSAAMKYAILRTKKTFCPGIRNYAYGKPGDGHVTSLMILFEKFDPVALKIGMVDIE